MLLITQGLLEPLLVTQGFASSTGVAQSFEQALLARLLSIPDLTDIVGNAITKTGLPELHDLGTFGPALTYFVPYKPYGHNLSGSDGTVTARVQFDAYSYSESDVEQIIEVIRLAIDGVPSVTWGNGTIDVMHCKQVHSADSDSGPRAGTDQWVYRKIVEYSIMYRVPPTDTATGIVASAGNQLFERALVARILSLPSVTDFIGNSLYKMAIPEMHDLGTFGPALVYAIQANPYGHDLGGSDGTATIHVELNAFAYSVSAPKLILEAIRSGIDGTIQQFWGDGSLEVMTCFQTGDIDEDAPPKAGTDQWMYRSLSEYLIKYRVAIPTP